MRRTICLSLILLAGLAACGRRSGGLYADRSIAVAAPVAAAGALPRFVGLWAGSTDQCRDPWVIAAQGLEGRDENCEFNKVDSSTAGYTIAATCRTSSGPKPVRLIITTPNQTKISMLTISGGPFASAAPLQRCFAE
jgi:hypothetical protein